MIEDDVRTMLRRRADDIGVEPRPWAELVAAPPVVEELRPAPSSSRQWLAVAAAILAVGVTATMLVGTRDEPTVPVQQVSGTSRPFDPATASPVWPLIDGPLTDGYRDPQFANPIGATTGYLADTLGGLETVLGPDETDAALGLSRVRWTLAADRQVGGTVYLRRVASNVGDRWLVVGATDDSVMFSAITYQGDRLRFALTAPEAIASLQVSVAVNGQSIGLGGPELTPRDAVRDPGFGQVFSLPPGEPIAVDTAVPTPVDGPPVVRVRQIKADYATVAEFAVQPDGGPPGGRLVAANNFGNKTWRLWAMDRAQGLDEGPCVELKVVAETVSGPVCGIGPGNRDDRDYFTQIGPVAKELGQVLIFGVVDAEVDTVGVFPESGDGQQVRTLVDPVHPQGARLFAVAVPVLDPVAMVELMRGDELLGKTGVQVMRNM